MNSIFTICFNLVPDNDLIWLQYRTLHRILGTKSLLYKMSKSDSNLCCNCALVEETIEHLFYYCSKVKNLLSELYSRLRPLTGCLYDFDIEDVLLGIIKRSDYSEPLNILILILKSYIFEASRQGHALNINALLYKIKKIYLEQEYLANLKSQLPNFQRKWALVNDLILASSFP